MVKSRILQEIHSTAEGLHKIGAISTVTIRDYDKICLTPVHELNPQEIKNLRERENVSQAIFASFLNTSLSTVQK